MGIKSYRSRAGSMIACVLLLVFGRLCTAAAAEPADRLRVIIETDAPGGDPDDEGSLVRFFLYLNEWDVEGLIGTRAAAQSRLGISGKDRILQYIDGYEEAYGNLKLHDPEYPAPDHLRRVTKQCCEGPEGRDHVVSILDADDARDVWCLNWGTNEEDDKPTALREALDHVQRTRSAAQYQRFASKVRYVGVYRQNHLGPHRRALGFYMDAFYPDMDGGRWYHRWRPLTARAGGFDVDRDIKRGHGPLCANYTIQKEGDTPTFMHLIPNGLNAPGRLDWGGWAGRFRFNDERNLWQCDQRDTWRGRTHRDNTLARWAAHLQNDFKARADWCVAESFEKANHPPVLVVEGDRTQNPVLRQAPVGSRLTLDAAATADPDNDKLRYEWFVYSEAGTYEGVVTLADATAPKCTVAIPPDAAGKTIHVVLQVTDDGEPPLTRYRRVVVEATRAQPPAP